MTKKYLAKLCAFTLASLLMLSSCGKTGESKSTAQTTSTNTSGQMESTAQTQNPIKDPNYTDLECESVKGFNYMNFVCGESVMAMNIALPNDWQIYKIDGTSYKVQKYGKELGKLYLGEESELDEGKTEVYNDTKILLGIESVYSVNRYGEEGNYSYRRKIVFNYTDGETPRTMTLDVEYTAIDDAGMNTMRDVMHFWKIMTVPEMGNLSFALENGKKDMLMLGNSFVATSRIGDILNELCAEEGVWINAVSRPNVSIKDYVKDPYMLERIENGEYSILFMCGFFSDDDVSGFETIYEACQKSGTVLVIFPAHNEDSKRVKKAQEKYPELITIDWKNEITQLIYSGISNWDFCMNDGPLHSTPLAGYVGAHMIYRALFGKMPTAEVTQSASGISQSYIRNKLGTYVKTGKICGALPNTVFYFDEPQ